MTATRAKYGAQVIVERGFASKEAAEVWLAEMAAAAKAHERGSAHTHVETHLWEPAK